jgi:ABC-type sugar transport system ATPase subunit
MSRKIPILETVNISKKYSQKTVVDDVSIQLMPGEIVSLIGENGAGKSTIKNMLVGLVEPTTGEIYFEGKDRRKMRPNDYRVVAVHQELSVFPSLSVAENICITNLPGDKGVVDWKACKEKAKKYAEMVKLEVNLDSSLELLSPGEAQLVEIAKALYQEPKALILDEPTASLSYPEKQRLFEVMRSLKNQDVGIIFITHFIDEVYEVSDKIIVLRSGRQVGSGIAADMERNSLEELLVGREMHQRKLDIGTPENEIALKVNDFQSDVFCDINFEVNKGEIVGIAGLMGAGRTEIVESIFGIRKVKGSIELSNRKFSKWSPSQLIKEGMIFVSEDRRNCGIFPFRPIKENISSVDIKAFIHQILNFFGFKGESKATAGTADKHSVSYASIENTVSSLSGGNQQKTILARWLYKEPKVCIFDDPTRGVDIGAKEEISLLISELAKRGCAVILVSSDVKELMEISHRIIVMRKGRFVADLDRKDFDAQKILSIAASTSILK